METFFQLFASKSLSPVLVFKFKTTTAIFLDNVVKMASGRRSFISLIFIINLKIYYEMPEYETRCFFFLNKFYYFPNETV